MTRQQCICDRCKEEVKPDGYSMSVTVGITDIAIDVKRGVDTNWENHYCGRNCLMLSVNGLVDLMQPVPAKESGAVVRQHEHAPAPQERKHACAC